MSRYTVEHNTPNNQKYWISFGWDFPMNTFFMQVEYDSAEDTEDFVDPTVRISAVLSTGCTAELMNSLNLARMS